MHSTDYVKSLVEDKCDPELGQKVRQHLKNLGIEHPTTADVFYKPEAAVAALEVGIFKAYLNLGLDVANDRSLMDTPKRFAKMFVGELTKGLNYDFFPKCTATPNGNVLVDPAPHTQSIINVQRDGKPLETVTGAYDEVVIIKSIRTTSLCEHHLQTIDGFTHIAYIPTTKVLGLSKFARVTEFFAARPQMQERMTEQIRGALTYILDTEDVAVVQNCVHFCMRARGVKQPESWTQTNKVSGRFKSNPSLREEFLHAIQ